MQARVVSQVTIHATPARVFKYLSNTDYHYLWNPHLQRITPRGPLRQSAKYRSDSMVFGIKISAQNTVTQFKKDSELEVTNDTGMVHYCVNYRLQRQDDDTVLICNTIVSSDSKSFAFTRPVLVQLAKRELQSDLQSLKVSVEQQLELP